MEPDAPPEPAVPPEVPAQPTRRQLGIAGVAVLVLVLAALAIGVYLLAPYVTRDRIETMARGAGPWGPLVLLAVQMVQILAAPIPGLLVPLVAGVLYGPVLGPLITAVGTLLGSTAAYWIGRKAGRALIQRWVGAEPLERAQRLLTGKRWVALAILFVLPVSPADALCFGAGVLGMGWGPFTAAVAVGRIPKDAVLALGWALGWAAFR